MTAPTGQTTPSWADHRGVSAALCAMLSRHPAKPGSPCGEDGWHFLGTGSLAGRGAPESGLLTEVTPLLLPCRAKAPGERAPSRLSPGLSYCV